MLACQDTRLVRTGSKKRTFSEVGGDSGLSALGSHSWGLNQPHHSGQWLVSSTDNTQPACSWLPSSPCGGAHSRGVSAETLDMDTPPDLSALRAAAAAAVADCTDTLREAPSRQSQDATSEQPSSSLPAQKTQFSGGERRRDLSSESDAPTPAAAAAAAPGTSQLKRYSGQLEISTESPTHAISNPAVLAGRVQLRTDSRYSCPPHGAKAICGRRPKMEDAYTAVPFLLEVPVHKDRPASADLLPPRIANEVKSAPSSVSSGASDAAAETSSSISEPVMETLHFFGVFDGHGGAEAALHCAQTLHQRIAEALSVATSPTARSDLGSTSASQTAFGSDTGSGSGDVSHLSKSQERSKSQELSKSQDAKSEPSPVEARLSSQELRALPAISTESESHKELVRSSDDMVDTVLQEQEGQGDDDKGDQGCSSAKFESAFADAFSRTDAEFAKADNAALIGTTAVAALVGSRHLYVANCGDSRAVLCRGGYACALTDDHKAAREDETARVEAAGGQILFWNGVRVMGVLAVSRAIGDHCLRPYVIADPEVTIVARRPEDELLLLASDGLWDVLSNQEAISLAKRCLRRARQRGASRQSAARIAATVLTRAAVDRGSRDNVTVVVVDLAPPSADSQASGADDCADEGFDEPGSASSLERQPSQKSRPRRDSSGASPSSTGASDHMGRLKLQTQSSHFSSEPSGSSEQG
ncbi:hypothetical protein WJX74_011082 [Apatococcus lobatus]|uniref:protein-serine/threonine phosphatase n=1 Tax=Apatococcus lobatus TaxID=904363 RepID=A0AAW1QNL0_9CHLO